MADEGTNMIRRRLILALVVLLSVTITSAWLGPPLESRRLLRSMTDIEDRGSPGMEVFFVSVLLPVAILCFFPLLTLIVAFFEKRYVWVLEPYSDDVTSVGKPGDQERPDENPYRSPALESSSHPLTEFARHKHCELEAIGYECLGRFRHVKGGIYQLWYEAWISSDRYVLAFVESGSLMAIPARNIIMVTLGERNAVADTLQRTSSLVCVESITHQNGYEPDVCGMTETMLFPAASAHEADVLHRQRLAFVRPRRFPCDALDDYHRFLIERIQIGYNTGWCRFVDEQHNVWLPTFKGAFRFYFKTYGFMLSRMVYSDRRRLKRKVNLQETTTPGL